MIHTSPSAYKPDTKMAPRHEDYCSEIDLTFGVADNL